MTGTSLMHKEHLKLIDLLEYDSKVYQCSHKIASNIIELIHHSDEIHRLLEIHSFHEALNHIKLCINLLNEGLSSIESTQYLAKDLEEIHLALLKMQDAQVI